MPRRAAVAAFILATVRLGLLLEVCARTATLLYFTLTTPVVAEQGQDALAMLQFHFADKGMIDQSEYHIHDSLLGYRPRPGLAGNLPGIGLQTVNSAGARGHREYTSDRPGGNLRIVAIGDSYTYGEGVGDSSNWPAWLERMIAPGEVINLGCSGYGHDQIFLRLRHEIDRYRPDLVILGYCPCGADRNLHGFLWYQKPVFRRRAGGDWELENVPVPAPETLRRRVLLTPRIWLLGRMIAERLRFPTTADRSELEEYLLTGMAHASERSGARFAILALPHLPPGIPEGYLTGLDRFAGRQRIPLIDASRLFDNARSEIPAADFARIYVSDRHYSGYANGLLAREVCLWIWADEDFRRFTTERPGCDLIPGQ